MSLYSAGYEEFVDEVLQNGCNGIVEKMRKSSKEKLFPKAVKKCEERIWKKTLPEFFKHLIDLKDKHSVTPTHIFLEYLMPMLDYRRCDAIIIAKSKEGKDICILYEMKSKVNISKIKKNISQVNGYYDTLNKMMINKTNEIKKFLFYVDNKITDKSEVLKEIKSDDSIFSNINESSDFSFLEIEEGIDIYNELEERNFISKVIGDSDNIILNKNQNKIFSEIISAVKNPSPTKRIFLISGDPGTGKTVLAMKFYKYFKKQKKTIKFLTSSIHMQHVIKNLFNQDVFLEYQEDNIEDKIIIFDEVHGSKGSTIKNILESSKAKVVILFMDKKQITKIDSLMTINENIFNNIKLKHFELESQFRCSNSNYYIDQIDNFLYDSSKIIKEDDKGHVLGITNEIKDLLIFVNKVSFKNIRIISNYTHASSYKIGDFTFTYHRINPGNGNRNDLIDAYNYNLSNTLYYGHEKIVGMPLTVQGFEYEYTAIIWDEDLYYDKKNQKWAFNKDFIIEENLKIHENEDEIIEILKNRYRVLLTRARKGCYIYFEHKETREYFEEVFNIKAQ